MSQPLEAETPDLKCRPPYPIAGVVRSSGVWLYSAAIGFALLAYVLVILFAPILREWDTYLSFSHLYVWIAELRAHEGLSTWTPLDANGYGSPLPFFYHKLFNLIGGLLAILSDDIVTGYRLTILAFSAAQFAGTYMCAQRLAADRILSATIAAASVLAPYYLIKIYSGTVAEYSADVLIPFIVMLILDARAARFGIGKAAALAAALLLLTLAHVLVAALAFGVLIPVVVYQCAVARKAYPALIATGLALTIFIVFFYVPFNFLGAEFSPSQAAIGGGVENHLYGLRDILSPSPLSSLGWPLYALLAGMVLYALRARRVTGPHRHAAFVLGCIGLAIVLMMMKFTRPFWQLGGPLEFIQFPFRLLSVATPLFLIAIAGLFAQLPRRAGRYAALALLLLAMVNAGRLVDIAAHAKSPYAPAERIISAAELNRQVPPQQIIGPDAGGEYLPAAFRPALARTDVFKTRISTILPPPRSLIETDGCSHPDIGRPLTLHLLQLQVTCAAGGTLRVNQFSTSILESDATNGTTTIHPRADSPFIEFTLPAGQWTVTVRQRNWLELTELAWRAKLALLSR